MIIRNHKAIDKFLKRHHKAREEIEAWVYAVNIKNWDNRGSLESDYFDIRFINDTRVVFKFGYRYRIDTLVNYATQIVFVKRIGTHEEYNKWKF